tara:strand:+ start:3136 stop:3738 length:603 start_codon:yes stop_codon:yes gene_type:complete
MNKMENQATRGTGLLESFLSKKRTSTAIRFIKKEHQTGRILDIGCGKFPLFLSKVDFREKHGVDYLPPIKSKEFKLKQLDLSQSKLPYKENYFDTVTMLAVLEHLDPERNPKLIKEVYRTLKPGKRLILTTPSPLGNNVLKVMARLNLVSKEEIDEHKKIYSLKELSLLLREAGFNIIKLGNFELFMNNYVCVEKPLNLQ